MAKVPEGAWLELRGLTRAPDLQGDVVEDHRRGDHVFVLLVARHGDPGTDAEGRHVDRSTEREVAPDEQSVVQGAAQVFGDLVLNQLTRVQLDVVRVPPLSRRHAQLAQRIGVVVVDLWAPPTDEPGKPGRDIPDVGEVGDARLGHCEAEAVLLVEQPGDLHALEWHAQVEEDAPEGVVLSVNRDGAPARVVQIVHVEQLSSLRSDHVVAPVCLVYGLSALLKSIIVQNC